MFNRPAGTAVQRAKGCVRSVMPAEPRRQTGLTAGRVASLLPRVGEHAGTRRLCLVDQPGIGMGSLRRRFRPRRRSIFRCGAFSVGSAHAGPIRQAAKGSLRVGPGGHRRSIFRCGNPSDPVEPFATPTRRGTGSCPSGPGRASRRVAKRAEQKGVLRLPLKRAEHDQNRVGVKAGKVTRTDRRAHDRPGFATIDWSECDMLVKSGSRFFQTTVLSDPPGARAPHV